MVIATFAAFSAIVHDFGRKSTIATGAGATGDPSHPFEADIVVELHE